MLHYLLAFIFAFAGIGGLILQVEIGVFAGLGLIAWELGRAGVPARVYQVVMVFAAAAGIIFFIYIQQWYWLIAFVFIVMLNLRGYYKFYGKSEYDKTSREERNLEDKKQ